MEEDNVDTENDKYRKTPPIAITRLSVNEKECSELIMQVEEVNVDSESKRYRKKNPSIHNHPTATSIYGSVQVRKKAVQS